MRSLLAAIGGAAVAFAFVLSCSDDSPGDADAAENCEPPLAGRINRIEDVKTAQSAMIVNAVANCPAGHVLLGGGCEVSGSFTERLVLFNAGGTNGQNFYSCSWSNPQSVTVETVRAWAVCLSPAP